MKETNYKLPNNWYWSTINQITKNFDGSRIPIKAEDRAKRNGIYPYYGASGIIDNIDHYIFDGEFLLIAEDGANLLSRSTPIAFIAKGKFWVNNHAHVVQTLSNIPLDYLEHYLNNLNVQFYTTGSAQPKLTQAALNKIPVPLPPLNEQRRIVSKIDALFERSRRARQFLEAIPPLLEKFRQSVLAAAFRGDLTKEWREKNKGVEPASALLERIRAERRNRWEETELTKMRVKGREPLNNDWKAKYVEPEPVDTSDLPELPEGWAWASVEFLSSKVVDGVHKKPNYIKEGIPFITVKNLTASSDISFDDLNYISEEDHKEFIKRAHPEKGDILVSKDGTLGVIRIIKTNKVFSIFVSVALIKPLLKEISDFLGMSLTAPQIKKQIKKTGTGLQHIHLVDLRAVCIPIPPLQEQAEIIRQLQKQFMATDKIKENLDVGLERLESLDQSILAKAFRGELVPQDPNDEPASVLLERIKAERAANEEAKNGKKAKPKPAAKQETQPQQPKTLNAEQPSTATSTIKKDEEGGQDMVQMSLFE